MKAEIPQGPLVILELIGARVHPDDIPSLNEMIDWARSFGSNFEYDHRLQMPTPKYHGHWCVEWRMFVCID
jgi:hypothetical protein